MKKRFLSFFFRRGASALCGRILTKRRTGRSRCSLSDLEGANAWLALERRGRGYVLSSLLAAALAIPLSPRACSAELAAELAFPQGSRGVFLSRILGWLLL